MEIEQMPTSESDQVDAAAQTVHDQKGDRLPWYAPASWRNTTPVDTIAGKIGVGFDCGDGGKIRLRLDISSAAHLAGSLTDALVVASVDLVRDAMRSDGATASRLTGSGEDQASSSSVGQESVSQQQEAADRAALTSILEQVILKYLDSDYDGIEDIAEMAASAFRVGLERYDLKHRPNLPTPVNAEASDELTMLHDQLQKAQLALVEYKVRAMTTCAGMDVQRTGTVSTPMCFSTEWANSTFAEIFRVISEAGR